MIYDFFPHDWNTRPRLEAAWQTSIQRSPYSGQEDRNGLAGRPTRMLTVQWTGMSRADSQRMTLALARAAESEIGVPIYMDQAITTASSSGTTINCPTETRRFFVGYPVVIYDPGTKAWEERTIESLTTTTITVTVGLSTSFPRGSLVFPVMQATLVPESSIPWVTDFYGKAQSVFLEVTDSRALPSTTDWSALPEGVQEVMVGTALALPIFPGRIHWEGVTMGVERAVSSQEIGRGTHIEAQGPRPLFAFSLPVLALDRDEAWRMIQFHDYVKGALTPFWLTAPMSMLQAVAWDEDWVEVEKVGNLADLEDFIKTVALVHEDGSKDFRRVTDVTDSGDAFRIVFDAPIDESDAETVEAAFLVRNKSDAMEEDWITDMHVSFVFDVIEIPDLNEDVEATVEEVE